MFAAPWLADGGHEPAYDLAFDIDIVRAEVERAGLRWLDTLPSTRAAGHATHGHPGARGHALLARRAGRRAGPRAALSDYSA